EVEGDEAQGHFSRLLGGRLWVQVRFIPQKNRNLHTAGWMRRGAPRQRVGRCCSRDIVCGSASPSKKVSNTCWKSGCSGAAAAKRVMLDHSLRSAGEPKICLADRSR